MLIVFDYYYFIVRIINFMFGALYIMSNEMEGFKGNSRKFIRRKF